MTKAKIVTLLWVFGFGFASLLYGMADRGSYYEVFFLAASAISAGAAYLRIMYK